MKLTIPELALVLLVGPSGAGKSTFARRHFKPTEVLSSDACRGLVSDDETNQDATKDAFEVLRFVAAKRLAAGRLTVIDATNVQPEARRPLVQLAREHHVLPVALVLDVDEKTCLARNAGRLDRDFGPHVIRNQLQQRQRSLRGLEREGFRHVHVLKPGDLEALELERQPLWNNLRHERGPFDVIGDVHGCLEELQQLLRELGYTVDDALGVTPPAGRKAVFLGDLVDRGPDTPGVLKLVMGMVEAGAALCVPGNHEMKLLRALRGKKVTVSHGLAESLDQLGRETPEFRARVAEFIDDLVSHYVLDGGKLVVAHAGMKASMQGRGSGAVRSFALYGETTGETDEYGLPVRFPWANEYRGAATVVYGHTPVPEAEWLNDTICIDTGCVFGGKLTALRWPERALVQVRAARTYCEPARPLVLASPGQARSAQQQHDDLLDLDDVVGKRVVETRLSGKVTIREENAAAALEAMSRFAVDPRWLIYLPPTMSPSETSQRDGYLERPEEALDYFRKQGVVSVVCEAKHMGSRAVVVLCRTPDVARARFGVPGGEAGACFTRTGRRFFADRALEVGFLARLRAAADAAGLWDALGSDWLCLDAEVMPWSLKAAELVRAQYAAVGAAAGAALAQVRAALARAAARGLDVAPLASKADGQADAVARYGAAWQRYCWAVASLDDVKLAPFHLLASEGAVHVDKDHRWHLDTLASLARVDSPFVLATPSRFVRLDDAPQVAEVVGWWEQLTGEGGEGMVVKPLSFIARGGRGLVQPAIKCRGRDYLRIIYGPDYAAPEHLTRLRQRGLSTKRGLALREFALGVEALERFVRKEPLRRVHEAVFGVLALESEPVDPRL